MTEPSYVRLANDVAAQFHHLPPDEAASEIANHLRMFWHPSMREHLQQHVAAGGVDLDPLVISAVHQLQAA